MNRKQRMEALIKANSVWAGQEELLEGLSDEQFAAIEAGVKTNEQKPVPVTEESFLAGLPQGELKENMESGLRLHRAQKASLVAALKANSRNKFTEDQLKGKTLDELHNLASLAGLDEEVVDFSGRSTGASSLKDNESDGVPDMPVMDFKKSA